MRRLRTSLVVVAIGGLALAAVVDGFLGNGQPAGVSARGTVPERKDATGAAELAAAGVAGTLVVRGPRCDVRELELPSLVEHRYAERACSLSVSPDGTVGLGETALDRGVTGARCRNGRVEVTTGGSPAFRLPGCEPAWRPDGRLTYVHEGQVRRADPCPRPAGAGRPGAPAGCSRVVLSRADLERALGGAAGSQVGVASLAWLDARTFAAIVRAGSGARPAEWLAIFRGRRLVGRAFGPYGRLGRLRASPDGRYVAAARLGYEPGAVVLARTGTFVRDVASASAVAWSSDGRVVAVAYGDRVDLLDRIDGRGDVHASVPLRAADAVWRRGGRTIAP